LLATVDIYSYNDYIILINETPGVVNVDERQYDRNVYDKINGMIEVIYTLNRLSNNSYIDENTKKYLIEMMDDAKYVKSYLNKYRFKDFYDEESSRGYNKYAAYDYSNKDNTFMNKIIFFLKSLNDY